MEQEQVAEKEEAVEVEVADPSIKEQKEQEVEVEVPTEEKAEAEPEKKEDELENYSKNVQARIKKLTEKYRKEERDREEAVRVSQRLLEENKQLKQRMDSLDQGYLSEYGTRLESQEDQAKRAYSEAHQAGDSEKMFEAQKALSKIAIEQERYRLAKDQAEKKEKDKEEETTEAVAETPQPQQKVSPKAKDWAEKNEWFGEDEIMTQAAFVVHNKLIQEEGFDPESDEYYSEIDRRMRTEFPHKFDKQKTSSGVQVASANSTASRNTQQKRRSVKLSPSQIAIAKKLGVPLEEYAKYVKD